MTGIAFRRADARGVRFQEIERSNDLAFCIEALARTDRIAVVPRVLYRYRINGGGLQSTKSASPDFWREALAEVRSRLERAGLLPRIAELFETRLWKDRVMKERQSSIELLRILAMLIIIAGHFLRQCGLAAAHLSLVMCSAF